MSESQQYSDIIALVKGLEEPELFMEVVERNSDTPDAMVIDTDLFEAMVDFIDTLLEAISDYLEMDREELGNFILMEKFKYDLFGDD